LLIKTKHITLKKLYDIAYKATINLDKVIDVNYYPSESAKFSNFLHRPIGLGVQGLADVFFKMDMPYGSDESKLLNKEIFETIYHASISASCDVAKENGPYSTFKGSPLSKGKFQFDLWGVEPTKRWDWEKLRKDVVQNGVRNSLTTAVMPTASTSSILGNEASIEAQTSNMYTRSVLSGTFILVNRHLVKKLIKLNLWNEEMRKKIILQNGSIQNIPEIPTELKEIYKVSHEVKQKDAIEMSADRGAFIDQTQSLNIFMNDPNFAKLTAMHMYGWGKRSLMVGDNGQPIIPTGDNIQIIYDSENKPKSYRDKKMSLKTGMYYLRSNSSTDAVKFTVREEEKTTEEQIDAIACSIDNPDDCDMCGS
jgi:ribonucleoside-diphosphate reductase alpha chain